MWPEAQEHVVRLGERTVKGKGTMTTFLLKVSVGLVTNAQLHARPDVSAR
jgi:hypothetical protein